MQYIVAEIMAQVDNIPQMNKMMKVSGNCDLKKILYEYEEYNLDKKTLLKPYSGPGRKPQKKQWSDDVNYIYSLIEKLYAKQERPLARKDALKKCIDNAFNGCDFFDLDKGKYWVDFLSALDYKLQLLSRGTEDSFEAFFEKYVDLYSKMNNQKTVPFYSRWLIEVCSMYTVYLHETIYERDEMLNMLENAWEQGKKNTDSETRKVSRNTDDIKNYLMTNIFSMYKKDKEKTLSELCKYIKTNPDEFVIIKGPKNHRYRRYYYACKEMLSWLIKNKEIFEFVSEDVVNYFIDDSIDYSEKDKKIKELEARIAGELDIYDQNIMSVFIDENAQFAKNNEDEIVISKWSSEGYLTGRTGNTEALLVETDRTIEQVVDSVVKLLRFCVILSFIYQAENSEEYEEPSREHLINRINRQLCKFGLLMLPTEVSVAYTSNTLIDLCILHYIESRFQKDNILEERNEY